MFYSHNNQLPRVKTAQVESVYGLIKAEEQMDLLQECFGSFCYTLTNPYRYVWRPAEEELTRKWAAADRNRSALWPTTCSLCMVPAPSGCRASGKTPFGAMRHRRGWMSKYLLRVLEHSESRNMNNDSRLFLLSLFYGKNAENAAIQFYGKNKKEQLRFLLLLLLSLLTQHQGRWRNFFFRINFPSKKKLKSSVFTALTGETESAKCCHHKPSESSTASIIFLKCCKSWRRLGSFWLRKIETNTSWMIDSQRQR